MGRVAFREAPCGAWTLLGDAGARLDGEVLLPPGVGLRIRSGEALGDQPPPRGRQPSPVLRREPEARLGGGEGPRP